MACQQKVISEANRINDDMRRYTLTEKDAYKVQIIAIMLFETGETLTEKNIDRYELAYKKYIDEDEATLLSEDIRKYILTNAEGE